MNMIIVGFILGGLTGCFAGVLLGLADYLRTAALPAVRAAPYVVYAALGLALPHAAPFQGALLIAVAVCVLTLTAIAELSDRYWDLARHFGASPAGLLHTIALPGAGPAILRRVLITTAVIVFSMVATGGKNA